MATDDTILARISALSAREFENLVYDCMKVIGVRNLIWRTPGADGGRDIEGQVYQRDISGHQTIDTWYVECKRYKTSINWPTVWKKISYADVSNADVFFLVTNSNPSPNCESLIKAWNSEKKKPAVRVWRGYDFPSFLRLHLSVSASYGLIHNPLPPQHQVTPIADLILRITHSAYSARVFERDSLYALETASALTELFRHRLNDLQQFGRFVPGQNALYLPQYDWLRVSGATHAWEDVSLRALSTFLHHLWQCDHIMLHCENQSAEFTARNPHCGPIVSDDPNFLEVLTWCRCEVEGIYDDGLRIVLYQRD